MALNLFTIRRKVGRQFFTGQVVPWSSNFADASTYGEASTATSFIESTLVGQYDLKVEDVEVVAYELQAIEIPMDQATNPWVK